MSHELFYTSAPRGLRPTDQGFCTVAATQGIPQSLATRLESLSGYRHLFAPSDKRAHLNPVAHSHFRLQVDGRVWHVLSRIADAGLDYSNRTNKFAHHVALERSELPVAGPAWLLAHSAFMEKNWGDRAPQLLPHGRRPISGDVSAQRCRRWEELTGDAGWGGVLASLAMSNKVVYLSYAPGVDPLPLLAESLALLPPSQRWNVSFTTYFLGLPPDVTCLWRCVVADSTEETNAAQSGALVIRLDRSAGRAPDGPNAEAARLGRPIAEDSAAAKPVRQIATQPIPVQSYVPAETRRHHPTNQAPVVPAAEVSEPQPMPMLPSPHARSGYGVLTLLLGLLLGLILMLLCVLPVELITGRSIPRSAGLVSQEEESLKLQLDEQRQLNEKLTKEVKQLSDENTAFQSGTRGTQGELNRAKEELESAKKREEKAKTELAAARQQLSEKETKIRELETQRDMLVKENAELKAKSASGSPMSAAKPPEIKAGVLSMPSDAENKDKLIGLKTGDGDVVKLIGLPDGLKAEAEEGKPTIVVKRDKHVVARFEPGKENQWRVVWEKQPPQLAADWNTAQRALGLCALRVESTNGKLVFYSLRPVTANPPDIPSLKKNGDASVFVGTIPERFHVNLAGLQDAVRIERATVLADDVKLSFKREGEALKGVDGWTLSLDGHDLRLQPPEGAKPKECKFKQLTLARRFEKQLPDQKDLIIVIAELGAE